MKKKVKDKLVNVNPVAKYCFVVNKNKVLKDKSKYNRKEKYLDRLYSL